MPLIPIPCDTTPLIAPLPVGSAVTRTTQTGQAPGSRPTESGTDVVAQKLTLTASQAWLERLMRKELAWPELLVRDELYKIPTRTVTYDVALLRLRVAEDDELDEVVTTPAATGASANTLGARAYAAFKDLGRWLMLDDPTVARMVGIKRTTPYAWGRDGRQPRPATVRRLLQHHSVVAAVVDRLGAGDALAWLAAGNPSPVDLLLDGRLDAVDELVGELVFARNVATPAAGAYIVEDEDDIPPSQIAARRG